MGEGGHGTVPFLTHFINELVLDLTERRHGAFLFVKVGFFFQPEPVSLSHHCYFTTRAMGAAELGPSKLRIYKYIKETQLLILQGWGVIHC